MTDAAANNSATDSDSAALVSDLSISKTDGSPTYTPGSPTTYTIVVSNGGPSDVVGASVADSFPAIVTSAAWTAVGTAGTSFSAGGSGAIGDTVGIPAGGSVTYTVVAQTSSAATADLVNSATVTAPAGVTDAAANNSATDSDSAALAAISASARPTAARPTPPAARPRTPSSSATAARPTSSARPWPTASRRSSRAPPGRPSGRPARASAPAARGAIGDTVGIPAGGSVTYTVRTPQRLSSAADAPTCVNSATRDRPAPAVTDAAANNSATDSDSAALVSDLSISKTDGSPTYTPGSPTTYTIVVSNGGPSDVVGASVADSFPAIVTSAAWTAVGTAGTSFSAGGSGAIGDTVGIPAGGSVTYTVVAQTSSAATADLVNSATVTAPAGVTDAAANNSATDSDSAALVSDLSISKTDGSPTYTPGSPTTYTIVVSNGGPSDVVGASVADSFPAIVTSAAWTAVGTAGTSFSAGGSGAIGDTVGIPAGGSVTYTVVAQTSSAATADLVNSATVTAPAGVTDAAANNSATDSDSAAPQANVADVKTADSSVIAGNQITFTIHVSNAGPSDALNVSLNDVLDGSLNNPMSTLDTGSGPGAPASWLGTLNLGTLIPGADYVVVITATVDSATPAGPLGNTASSTSTTPDPVPGNNSSTTSTTITLSSDLSISKTDGSPTYTPGSPTTYTIVVSNGGPSDVVGASVADSFPAIVTSAAWTAVGTAGTSFSAGGSGAIGDTVGIPAGGSVTYTVVAQTSSAATADLVNSATVTAPAGVTDAAANNSATDSDSAALVSDLSISKTDGSPTYTPGSPTTYTIVVSNGGPSDVVGASVADSFPAIVTSAAWTAVGTAGTSFSAGGSGAIGDTVGIPAGGSVTYTVVAQTSSAATADLVNSATVTAPAGVTDAAANNSATDTDTLTPQADLSISKTDGVTTAVPGSFVTYTIVVSNAGPSNAVGVSVSDTFPATISASWTAAGLGGATGFTASGSGNIGDTVNLPVGATITYTVHANIAAGATGSLVNTATLSHAADSSPANNSATDTDTLTPQADLSITKTDGVTTAVPGSFVTYTIVVSNAGPSNAVGASVSDTFPATISASWTAAGLGGATGFTASGSGNIGDTVNLPVGATIAYTVHANIAAGATGSLVNTATLSHAADSSPANNSATDTDTLTPQADLSISKTDGVTTAVPGSFVTYTIVVGNAGPSNAVGVSVSDTFPATISASWTAAGLGGATGFTASGSGNIGDTVNLPVGATIAYTVHANIAAGATGSLVNTATLSHAADSSPANNSATDTDTLTPQADLSISKAASANPVTVGDEFNYLITVTNNGPSANTGFTVTDLLPEEVNFVSETEAHCTTAPSGATTLVTCVNTVGLANGASVTYTIRVSADLVPGALNTATIIATSPTDPNNANDSSTITITINAGTLLSDVATGDPEWLHNLDGVDVLFQKSGSTYKLKATNPGTFDYRLSLENETGLDIRTKGSHAPDILKNGVTLKDRNGASTTVYLTVPSMPNDTGTGANYPLTAAQKAEPAFVFDGNKPVKAHPDDRSDDMPITVSYIPNTAPAVADCSTATTYIPLPSNANGIIARCIRVEGLEIPRHHEAHVHVSYEFRWKDTQNWGSATTDPTIAFRAGFNFKDTTVIELLTMPADLEAKLDQKLLKVPANIRPAYKAAFMSLWNNTYTGSHALGLVFAGEKVTAVGGFVFSPSAIGVPGVNVRLWKTAQTNFCSGTPWAQTTTGADGFYFIWKNGSDQTDANPATLDYGPKYYVALCDPNTGDNIGMPFDQKYWPARQMDHTLGNKEFDEEDFFVSGPTSLAFTQQPVSGKKNTSMSTVKVSLIDGFGQVMTLDTGTGASTVTISKASGSANPGTLSASSGLTKTMINGVVTWTDLRINAAGVLQLYADSAGPSGSVPPETSLPINITN